MIYIGHIDGCKGAAGEKELWIYPPLTMQLEDVSYVGPPAGTPALTPHAAIQTTRTLAESQVIDLSKDDTDMLTIVFPDEAFMIRQAGVKQALRGCGSGMAQFVGNMLWAWHALSSVTDFYIESFDAMLHPSLRRHRNVLLEHLLYGCSEEDDTRHDEIYRRSGGNIGWFRPDLLPPLPATPC